VLKEKAQADDSDCIDSQSTLDEVGIKDDLVAFPHEYDMSLGKELLDTFQSDIMALIHPGMGEMLKAVLVKQKFGVAIIRNAAHKNLLMKNLRDFVKSMNLVSFADAPPKPASLIAYEKGLAGNRQQPEAMPSSQTGPP
jgi:hypothetical protein